MNDKLLISLIEQVKSRSLIFSQGVFRTDEGHFFSILTDRSYANTALARNSTVTAPTIAVLSPLSMAV